MMMSRKIIMSISEVTMLASRLHNGFQKHQDRPALWVTRTTHTYRELQDVVPGVLMASSMRRTLRLLQF